jgi:hypothetical protein
MYPNYKGANKSLARPTSRWILFDGENISFDASLVIYIKSINNPPIIIINRIYETQNLVAVACFLPGRAKDLSAPLYVGRILWNLSTLIADYMVSHESKGQVQVTLEKATKFPQGE